MQNGSGEGKYINYQSRKSAEIREEQSNPTAGMGRTDELRRVRPTIRTWSAPEKTEKARRPKERTLVDF
jgi:hypothetical protein